MTRFPRSLFALALVGAISVACTSVTPVVTPTGAQSTPTLAPSAAPSGTDAPPTDLPSGSPTETPGSSDAPTETPGGPSEPPASIDPALAAEIDAVLEQVPPIRQLEALEDVPYEFISREQFQQDLMEMDEEEVPAEVRAAEERLLKRLGLLPDDVSLDALLEELYGGQVAAYYVPEEGRFYIIERDEPFGALDKVFVSHEYTHALQDQHFDLEGNRITDLTEGDAALAQLSAIEGDATLTMQQWAVQSLSQSELLEILTASLSGLDDDVLADMPLVLRRQLEFPYTEGFLFINEVWGLGGFEAVDGALQTPPASTEQILHPQKFYDQELPVDVTLEDISATLGDGWSLVYEQTMGELLVQVLATGGEEPPFSLPGMPVTWPHAEIAEGWGGDRLNMYENTDGDWGILWQTAWDTESDAVEFETRMVELLSSFDGFMVVEAGSGGPLHREVAIANDAAVLSQLTQ
ncbi:MAG TPA: hypothetical protein VEX62_11830 [Candidatus Limnocylindrales bacterium]|nr:hypothetical protein [Candidatus Limnocylindrales bacterium]